MRTKIRIGDCFFVKFTHRTIAVRVEDNAPCGGWVARSLSHGRQVLIKDVSQIVHRCDENGIEIVADATVPYRRSQKITPLPRPIVPEPRPEKTVSQFPFVLQEQQNLLDAAVIVLKKNDRHPMSARQIIEAVIQQALWTSKGRTPWLTLHTAMSREIAKGPASRFRKAKQRGKFQLK